MLSRKYYKHFANIIKVAYEQQYLKNASITGKIENHKELSIISELNENLIELFRSDNPNFNENIYKNACNPNLKELQKQLEVE